VIIMGYCSATDVGIRLGLDSGQRDRAATRITSAIQRAGINIDQEFRDYGRASPSSFTASTTLNGAIDTGAATIVLTSGTAFSAAGNGNIDGDSFVWTGKSTNTLTGVTGIDFAHATGATVEEGEMAAVIREICADLAGAIYLEDDTAFHTSGGEALRSNVLRLRGKGELKRLAHLGSVD
tara:strand:- start:6 stop:545 length:540 start_codon:yes stop_codon:yes gene_type:complete